MLSLLLFLLAWVPAEPCAPEVMPPRCVGRGPCAVTVRECDGRLRSYLVVQGGVWRSEVLAVTAGGVILLEAPPVGRLIYAPELAAAFVLDNPGLLWP